MIPTYLLLAYMDKRLGVPNKDIQLKIVEWYYHYLRPPGENRLEDTIVAIMWWRGIRPHISKHVKTCLRFVSVSMDTYRLR